MVLRFFRFSIEIIKRKKEYCHQFSQSWWKTLSWNDDDDDEGPLFIVSISCPFFSKWLIQTPSQRRECMGRRWRKVIVINEFLFFFSPFKQRQQQQQQQQHDKKKKMLLCFVLRSDVTWPIRHDVKVLNSSSLSKREMRCAALLYRRKRGKKGRDQLLKCCLEYFFFNFFFQKRENKIILCGWVLENIRDCSVVKMCVLCVKMPDERGTFGGGGGGNLWGAVLALLHWTNLVSTRGFSR